MSDYQLFLLAWFIGWLWVKSGLDDWIYRQFVRAMLALIRARRAHKRVSGDQDVFRLIPRGEKQ